MSSRNDDLEFPGDEFGGRPLARTLDAPVGGGVFAPPDPHGSGGGASEVSRRVTLVTVAAVSGIALGTVALLATKNGESSPAWLVLLIAAIAGLTLLARNFAAGIVLFLGVCWIVVRTPDVATGGSGGGQGLPLSQLGLAALLAIWVAKRFAAQDFRLYKMPILAPIALYLLVCSWSTINSLVFRDPQVMKHSFVQYTQVNILEMALRVLALGAAVMIANTLEGRALRWAAAVLLLPGLATFSGLLPFLPSTNYLTFAQVISASVLVAFVLTGQGPLWLRVVGGAFALSILGRLLLNGTEWVSGWFACLAALAVVTFFAQRRLLAVACIVLTLLVVVRFDYFYEKVYVTNFYKGSLSNNRTDMVRAGVLYATKFPLGIGLGNYRQYNQWYGSKAVWNTTAFSSAHGTIAQSLSETGFLGLLAFLLLIASIVRTLYLAWRAMPPGRAKSYVLGALGAVIGIASAAAFNGDYLFPTYHNGAMATFGATVYVFFLIGVVGAIAREHGVVFAAAVSPAPAPPPAPVVPVPAPLRERTASRRPAPLINRPLGGATSRTAMGEPRS